MCLDFHLQIEIKTNNFCRSTYNNPSSIGGEVPMIAGF